MDFQAPGPALPAVAFQERVCARSHVCACTCMSFSVILPFKQANTLCKKDNKGFREDMKLLCNPLTHEGTIKMLQLVQRKIQSHPYVSWQEQPQVCSIATEQ